jgi:putative PIN family toxin of toxin-antitoxin system
MRWVVVFDTNILLSALLSPLSNPSKCLKIAKTDMIQSVTCQEIIDEFQEKLTSKFKYSTSESQKIINDFLDYSTIVKITNLVGRQEQVKSLHSKN